MKEYSWGIIGLGNIAHEFAQSLTAYRQIYAVASRNFSTAQAFQKKYGAKHAYPSYEDLLRDPNVDIVYIATVNSQHFSNILACLENGKHVLCEKAIWGNLSEMKYARQLAQSKGLILCEGMTIYHMPLMKKLKSMIEEGTLGTIKFLEAELGSLKEDDPNNRFFSKELGGGSMLDIGTYGLSFVTYFLEGTIIDTQHLMSRYQTGVDEMWVIALKTDKNQLGSVNITFRSKLPKRAIIAGDQAYVTIYNYVRAEDARIVYADGQEEQIHCGATSDALLYEIQDMEQAVQTGSESYTYLDCTMNVVEIMDDLIKKEGL